VQFQVIGGKMDIVHGPKVLPKMHPCYFKEELFQINLIMIFLKQEKSTLKTLLVSALFYNNLLLSAKMII